MTILPPAMYMGSYYTILKEGIRTVDGKGNYHYTFPIYRVESIIAQDSFWPAHQIDRKIRPDYWGD